MGGRGGRPSRRCAGEAYSNHVCIQIYNPAGTFVTAMSDFEHDPRIKAVTRLLAVAARSALAHAARAMLRCRRGIEAVTR